MVNRILNIAWKDMLHLWHNRLLLVLVIFGAASELLLIGFATGAEINDLNTVVIDRDDSRTSQALINALRQNSTLEIKRVITPDQAAITNYDPTSLHTRSNALDDLFTSGNYVFDPSPVLLLEIPADFEALLTDRRPPEITLTLNGANSLPSQTARRAAEDEIIAFGYMYRAQQQADPGTATSPVTISASVKEQTLRELAAIQPNVLVRYNESLDRAHYTAPSETAFILYIMTIMVAAVLLAREREYGTFEQLLVMPMRPIEIIVGKAIPALLVGYANFVLLLGVMNLVFGIPVRGSLPLLLLLALAYLFVELGRGFLVAMISRTQNQALLIIMLIAFVDITFSGYAVPVESMPGLMQAAANFFPIRHWMIILRGILQKDVGLDILWPQLVWLGVLGVIINVTTLWFFRRTLGEQR